MNKQIADIIYSAIIGDASGYTLGGMKKAHISAVFKDNEGYPDPSPALKNNMDKWKKSGFYSSITQFMILSSACIDSRTFSRRKFLDVVSATPEIPDTEYSYFRDPGSAEKNFIITAKSEKLPDTIPYGKSCARLLPAAIPLLLIEDHTALLEAVIDYVSLFTVNTTTITYSFFFLRLLSDIIETGSEHKTSEIALKSARNALHELSERQNLIFSSGYNPDYFITEAERYVSLIEKLAIVPDCDKAEKIICDNANLRLKSPVTRGSVNLPECILPFAVILSEKTGNSGEIFHRASREGGAASALAAVAGAITCACSGKNIPEILFENLANKKKISTMLDIISTKPDRTELIRFMSEAEPGLTMKEIEEYKAKNKNEIKTSKPAKTRKDVESELTKHVVESWTKVDKAKWRKERNRNES